MLTLVTIAFTMGLIGSLHCIGMCGPLALSLPVAHDNLFQKISGAFLYNLGRVTTYAVAGMLVGFIGQSVSFAGTQNWISVSMGILILIYIIIPKDYSGNTWFAKKFNSFFISLRSQLGLLFSSKAKGTLYVIGLLNGLLPCGMVYLALASAIATGNAAKGALFMALFGLGTLPAMFSITVLGNFINQNIRLKMQKAVPAFLLVMSMLLILRGMSLGVPYLSPKLETKGAVHSCCTKPS
jgi:uncharacterized protein